ncbi:54S ribosomal protein L3 mitochondrial [Malassezia nana]|uniref:Large ribosomal subunit protein mL44 n=1 Tax=Malassezia nana TaxID=180528 RepID=A0AAF0J3A3_9BASI|nr:54S ribosomal protein L3 mitochondrial [Malassezia nana]
MLRAFSTGSVYMNATPVSFLPSSLTDAPQGHLPRMARTHPALWTSLRSQVPSAIASLGARVHLLPSSLPEEERRRRMELVRVACTHPSALAVQVAARELALSHTERDEVPELQETIEHNAQLATLGNALLGLLASEYFHLKYPHLPTRVLKAFVSAYVGPSTLANVGAELGVLGQGVQRWDRTGASVVVRPLARGGTTSVPLLSKDVAAQSMRALVAVLFQELGMAATRGFVHGQILSRRLDLANLLKFRDPKRVLSSTCKKYGKPAPQSRLLAETGRLSINPVFVVGVFCGPVKLGEGTGSSIRMAEYRAAEDALRRLYLSERTDGTFVLPSTTLDVSRAGHGPMPHSLQNAAARFMSTRFEAQPLGRSEVLHESRG